MDKPVRSEKLKVLLPEVWALMKPRTHILALGALLMIINRICGFALPVSTKYLIGDVMRRHQNDRLLPIVLTVALATMIQGITSFSLTQVLSKAAQRLITEMRMKVQEHIGRLPVRFYDANKTGTLVARIMSDVEGIRNLMGTGLVELGGGLLTAVISAVLLFRISATMTGLTSRCDSGVYVHPAESVQAVRPIFRERGKINAEVTGRLTESLGGVRVIKGYHAEAREAELSPRACGGCSTTYLLP